MPRNPAERLSALVQIPTVSASMESTGIAPFERLIESLRLFYPLLHSSLECERVTDLGLLFHWRGTNASHSTSPLVLLAHFDVVPVKKAEQWTHPPFSGAIADDRVWGRGAFDNKAGVVAICEAVESLLARGFTPERDIYLSFGGDEETTGHAAQAIAYTLNDRGIRPHLVLDAGGAIVEAPLPHVDGMAAMVGVAEKGIMTIKLSTEGHPGQASAPSKRNPISRIGRAVARVTSSAFPARLPNAVRTMLAAFAPHASGRYRYLYRSLSRTPRLTAQLLARLGGQAGALAHTTLAPIMIEGSTTSSQLPTEASAMIDVRIALGETVGTTLSLIRRRIGDPKVVVTMVHGSDPCDESSTDNAQYAAICQCVEASYPGVVTAPYVMMAATDSRHFYHSTDAVYRFSPLILSTQQRPNSHGVDEWVEIDSLHRGQVFYEHLIRTTTAYE